MSRAKSPFSITPKPTSRQRDQDPTAPTVCQVE
jgi:hypothetical protein